MGFRNTPIVISKNDAWMLRRVLEKNKLIYDVSYIGKEAHFKLVGGSSEVNQKIHEKIKDFYDCERNLSKLLISNVSSENDKRVGGSIGWLLDVFSVILVLLLPIFTIVVMKHTDSNLPLWVSLFVHSCLVYDMFKFNKFGRYYKKARLNDGHVFCSGLLTLITVIIFIFYDAITWMLT